VQNMGAVKTGDPLKEDTQIGPLARHDLARSSCTVRSRRALPRVRAARSGGAIPNDPGAYYPPTVLTDVHRGCRLMRKSCFGPVAAIFRSRTRKRRSRLPTDRRSGGRCVITRDLAPGEHIGCERIESGCVLRQRSRAPPTRDSPSAASRKRLRTRALRLRKSKSL